MAHHTAELDFTPPAAIARAGNIALLAGIIGFVILGLGVATSGVPGLFYRSYLVALIFWVGPAIGCLGMLMLQHVITGSWGLVIRRVLEAATRTLPLVAIFFPAGALRNDARRWASLSLGASRTRRPANR